MRRLSRPFRESFLWRWTVTPERIENLKKDLEVLGLFDIRFYKSTFSYWSLENWLLYK